MPRSESPSPCQFSNKHRQADGELGLHSGRCPIACHACRLEIADAGEGGSLVVDEQVGQSPFEFGWPRRSDATPDMLSP